MSVKGSSRISSQTMETNLFSLWVRLVQKDRHFSVVLGLALARKCRPSLILIWYLGLIYPCWFCWVYFFRVVPSSPTSQLVARTLQIWCLRKIVRWIYSVRKGLYIMKFIHVMHYAMSNDEIKVKLTKHWANHARM